MLIEMRFDIGSEKTNLTAKNLNLAHFSMQTFANFIIHMPYNDIHIDTGIKFYSVNGIVDLVCVYGSSHLVTFLFVDCFHGLNVSSVATLSSDFQGVSVSV